MSSLNWKIWVIENSCVNYYSIKIIPYKVVSSRFTDYFIRAEAVYWCYLDEITVRNTEYYNETGNVLFYLDKQYVNR